ncbi:hypothetical protein F4824DRAFT_509983 [Ustulina deusta]|nr:hypothetical protein F4824DRAFT_509983 [Ustulina deusta]
MVQPSYSEEEADIYKDCGGKNNVASALEPKADQHITYTDPVRLFKRESREGSDGSRWSRKLGSDGSWGDWGPLDSELQGLLEELHLVFLMLVRGKQIVGAYYWSLAVVPDGKPPTCIYQVTNDPEHMYYSHCLDAPDDVFASDIYIDSYDIGHLNDDSLALLDQVVSRQLPLRADNRALVTENCQGWTMRVIKEPRTVVSADSMAMAEILMEPLP